VSEKTNLQYQTEAANVRKIFINKNKDYGNSWKIMRIPSLIDQIYIKADRIRNIEDGTIPQVEDDLATEYIGIINYCIITLIQQEIKKQGTDIHTFDELLTRYDFYLREAHELMKKKNHDYGEAWRNMYITSFTDLILARILRIRQILENQGKTLVSEGLEANLYDMINYAFFALIKLKEQNENR